MNKKILKIVMVVCLGILGVFGGMFDFGEKNASALTEIDITIPEDIIEGGSSGGGNSSGSHSFGGGGENESDNSGKSLDERLECNNIVKESGAKIGPMQWILCPSMDNSRYTATWVDNLTQDWLEQDTEDYKPGSAAEIGWGYVRNIANVVMVIFLMIVIFSQLTGRGIDNYGIKKMLPRLIVMAIVVNLSFYICVVLVDLSNIAGEGLKNMFGSIGTQIAGDQQVTGAPFLGAMIAGLFSAAGGAGAAVGAGLTVAGLGLTATALVPVIIAVVVLCLIILAAVMTLFLMLGARRIIVIFCIVIAPLAFAAFILPNTQNLFKKWWELLKTALIIFPICGALGGISYMLRAIALTGNARYSVVELILLMLLPYLSFFLLPMLLKNALSALGKLGGALTSMGNTIRNGGRAIGHSAMRVAQNTEGYKNLQNEAARRRQEQSSKRTIERLEALKKENNGQLSDRDTRRLARAQEVQRKLGLEDQAARTILTEKEYAGRSLDDLVNDWNKAFDDGEVDRMNALTNVIVSRHGPGGVSQIASKMAEKNIFVQNPNGVDEAHPDGMAFRNDAMENSFTALQANLLQNSAFANALQNKASDVFQMVSGGGYVNGKRQDVAIHAANNGISTQMKDWVTQSNGTLRRAAENGGFTQQMARDILNSTDPAIQSGIQSDKDKRATLEAIAGGYVNRSWSDKQAVDEAASRYRATSAGVVSGSYANMSAADVYQEAQDENIRRIEDAQNRIQEAGGMRPEYVGRTAADVYREAQSENVQRQGGMNSEYINRTAREVAPEAWAENERRNQEQARNTERMNTLHGQALEENKEFDRRAEERRSQKAQADALQKIADNTERILNNQKNDNNSGQGFNNGAGI